MANNFTTKILANGQLSATPDSTLYTTPALTTAIIKTIAIVNTDSSTRAINLYIRKAAGTSRRIIPKDMSLLAGYSTETDEVYTLGIGDLITGDASSGTVVDYSIYGVEET
jgi:hypothetical protein